MNCNLRENKMKLINEEAVNYKSVVEEGIKETMILMKIKMTMEQPFHLFI